MRVNLFRLVLSMALILAATASFVTYETFTSTEGESISPAVPAGANVTDPRNRPANLSTWEQTSYVNTELAGTVVMRDLPRGTGLAAPPSRTPGSQPGMPISMEEADRRRQASMRMPANPRIRAGFSGAMAPVPSAPSLSLWAEAVDAGENPGTLTPPDPELAVGQNHAIAAVNVSFAIYDKSTSAELTMVDFETFFSGVAGCVGVFDPNALYDEDQDRYILAIDGNGDTYCIGVSQTGDPMGTWNLYSFPTLPGSCGTFFDYPHAGVGDDAIYMGANMFGFFGFCEGRVWALDKFAMYAGAAATGAVQSTGGESTPQPMNLHGAAQGTWPSGGPHYILTDDVFDGATFAQWSWSDPFGANTFVRDGDVSWPGGAQGFPVTAQTRGGGTLTANDFRVQDAEYRNGSIFTVHTVACNPGGGTVNCFQWAEYNPATLSVVQGGVYGSNQGHRIFADLAANHCEDMVVGYTGTNANVRPVMLMAGRLGSLPAGVLSKDFIIKIGEADFTSFETQPWRWGDYTGATSDPNGVDLWYLGQASKETGVQTKWSTYIAKVDGLNCGS